MGKSLVQLMHEIENDYGSVMNCPEDDKRLIQASKLTGSNQWSFDCPPEVDSALDVEIPSYAKVSEAMKEIHVIRDFKDVYDNAYKHGLTLRKSSSDLGHETGYVKTLYTSGKNPERFEYIIEYDGHIIKGKSKKGVISQARALGYHDSIDKAINDLHLRREVTLAPVVFNYGAEDEYRWKY